MNYTVLILRRVQRELAGIDKPAYDRILQAIRSLGGAPRPDGCVKLTGRDGWRIRVGDYRVLYEIDDTAKTVTVVNVGHRRDVYR
jgi:mRNA interferase RelE/StbE